MGLNTALKALRYVLKRDKDAKLLLENLAKQLDVRFSFQDIEGRWFWVSEILEG